MRVSAGPGMLPWNRVATDNTLQHLSVALQPDNPKSLSPSSHGILLSMCLPPHLLPLCMTLYLFSSYLFFFKLISVVLCLLTFGYTGSSLLCMAFSSCSEQGLLSVSNVWASLVAGHRLQRSWTQQLWHMGLVSLIVSCTGRQNPHHWTTREVLSSSSQKITSHAGLRTRPMPV